MITIKCTKGLLLEGGEVPVMAGEMFELIDSDNMEFEGIEGKSINPKMTICFFQEQLANNFEFIVAS